MVAPCGENNRTPVVTLPKTNTDTYPRHRSLYSSSLPQIQPNETRMTSYNITAAQLSMEELLSEIQVPGPTTVPRLRMDGAEDASIIDDLTFAELFTQDAIFKELDTASTASTPTPAPPAPSAAQQELSLAAAIFDLPTTVTSPAHPAHRRAPAPSAGHALNTQTAASAARSAVVGHAAVAGGPKLPGQGELETPEWNGIVPDRFEDLEEEMISLIPYRELAKLMARSKMTDRQIAEAKKLRRRVKNRQSARVCSTRKKVTTKATEFTNAELHSSITELTAQNQGLLQQHLQLQQQVIAMQKAQQDAVREKLAMELELQSMQKRLQEATRGAVIAGVNAATTPPMDFPLPDTLFAIAA